MDKKELFRAIDACKDNFIKEAAEDIQKRKPSVIQRFFFVNSSENAEKDMKKLDHSAQIQVLKGIMKVSKNPLPAEEGGYGKPLGNKSGTNLTNLLKIKFRDLGIRVVYKIERVNGVMKIIVVSARTDEKVYKEAAKRRNRYEL